MDELLRTDLLIHFDHNFDQILKLKQNIADHYAIVLSR